MTPPWPRLFITLASLSGMLAVILGAFGAHALRERGSTSYAMGVFETAVQYHFYHSPGPAGGWLFWP